MDSSLTSRPRSCAFRDGERDGFSREGHVLPEGFEEDEGLRSTFIRRLILDQADAPQANGDAHAQSIPRTLVRYWHDPDGVPEDVRDCMRSWDRLRDEGFVVRTFDDVSATEYIARRYARREVEAFRRCRHPAMRSDYLRMCFILADGGVYVDADDVLVGRGLDGLLSDRSLKLQPLCYDLGANAMASSGDVWKKDLPAGDRVFYVNNDPMVAPAAHPVMARALARATARLLSDASRLEIQATTGPGNLTAALAAHARGLEASARGFDFRFIEDWSEIAEIRWNLSYRNDARNWRNMDLG